MIEHIYLSSTFKPKEISKRNSEQIWKSNYTWQISEELQEAIKGDTMD